MLNISQHYLQEMVIIC